MNASDVSSTMLVKSLRSDVCPACGRFKTPAQTLCKRDYKKLRPSLRNALYDRLGEGYEEAVANAMTALGVEDFITPAEAKS